MIPDFFEEENSKNIDFFTEGSDVKPLYNEQNPVSSDGFFDADPSDVSSESWQDRLFKIKPSNEQIRYAEEKTLEELKQMSSAEKYQYAQDLKTQREFQQSKGFSKGLLSGATFGLSEKIPGLEPEEEDLMVGLGEFVGSALPIHKLYKYLGAPLVKLAAKSPIAKGALQSLARITGFGLTGAAYEGVKETIDTGEIPDPSEMLTHGAQWAAVDAALQAAGASGRFLSKLKQAASIKGISNKEALNGLIEKVENNGVNLLKQPAEALMELDKELEAVKPEKPKPVSQQISYEIPEPEKQKLDLKTRLIDELRPIERYVEDLVQGDKINISEDPYKLARLMKGVTGKVDSWLEYKTFDKDLNWKNPGLFEILKPQEKDLKGFSEYVTAKRSLELQKRDIKTGVDLEDAKRVVENGKNKYEKSAEELQQYNSDLLDYAVSKDLLDPSLADQFKKTFYVPFQREMGSEGARQAGIKTPPLSPKSPFYKMEGSERKIIDPLESTIGNTYKILAASDKNEVVKSLVDLAKKKKGVGSLIEEIPLESSTKETPQVFEEALNQPQFFSPTEDTVSYFEGGKKFTYKVPKDVAEAVKGMTPAEFSVFDKLLSFPTRFKRGAIVLDPTFIVRSFGRDVIDSWIYSKYGITPVVDNVKGLFHAFKRDDLYHRWKAAGGGHSTRYDLSRTSNRKQLEDLERKYRFKNVFSNPVDAIKTILKTTEYIGEKVESASRLGEFAKALQKGADPREAALAAREVTIDFARRGRDPALQLITKLSLFTNPTIQGASKFIKELKTNPKAWVKGISSITLPTLALYNWNKDNPDYKELADWDKNNYWHIFNESGKGPKHIRIRKPDEIGQIFATLPELVANYVDDQDPYAVGEGLKEIASTFVPNLMPVAVEPFMEHWANKKYFTGRPIIPERLKNIKPVYQELPKTRESSKAVAHYLNAVVNQIGRPLDIETGGPSPVILDHYIDAWLGPVGKEIEDGIGWITGSNQQEPSKEWSDYPAFKAFIGKDTGRNAKSITDFYDISRHLTQQKNTLNYLKKKGKDEDYAKEKSQFNETMYKKANDVKKALSKNMDYMNSILQDDTGLYSPDEKKRLIDEQTRILIERTRDFNQLFRETKIPRKESSK